VNAFTILMNSARQLATRTLPLKLMTLRQENTGCGILFFSFSEKNSVFGVGVKLKAVESF